MHTNYVYKPNHLIFDAKYTLDSRKWQNIHAKTPRELFGSFGLLYLNPLWKWKRNRKSKNYERITTPTVSQSTGPPVMRNHNITKEPLFISVALIFRNENGTAGYWMSSIHPIFLNAEKVFHSIHFNSFTIRCFVCMSLSLVSLLYNTVEFFKLAIKWMVTIFTKGKI